MKKLLILFIVLLTALDNYGQFTFGPKIGYNTSKLTTDVDSISESIKHNFQIGAFARFGKKLYIQPEIFYGTSGGTLEIEGSAVKKEEVKFNNLSIPVLVGFKLIDAKVFNIRVMAGPVANFILGTKVEASEVIEDPLQDNDFKNASWGMDVGAGVDVLFLTLDIRYEFGLNNIYNGSEDHSIKSKLFIVSLGFKLM
jgi:hypothetical protein